MPTVADETQSRDMAFVVLDDLQVQLNLSEHLHTQATQMQKNVVVIAQKIVAFALSIPDQIREQWKEICREVASAQTERAQQKRDSLGIRVSKDLSILVKLGEIAAIAARNSAEKIAWVEKIAPAITDLERFRDTILVRWKTPEDLEGLVVEYYPLSAHQLEQLAEQYPPPQAWYDEADLPS